MVIRVGILGCGMIGQSFIKQAIDYEKIKITALYSRTQTSLNVALEFAPNAKSYLNKEEFYKDSDVDAVIICTPHIQHMQDTKMAINYGKHVLIEKPLCTNSADLKELLNLANQRKDIVITVLPHTQYEFINKTQQLIKSGMIGFITAIHSYLDVPGPPRSNWYYSKNAIGGASLDTLPYALSRVFAIVEQSAKHALGFHNQLIKRRKCGDGGHIEQHVDDNATLILSFPYGQQAIVRSSWNVASPADFTEIHGRNGSIIIDAWRQTVTLHSQVTTDEMSIEFAECADGVFQYQAPIVHDELRKLRFFVQNIENNTGNFDRVCYQMQILLALLESQGVLDLDKNFDYGESSIIEQLKIGDGYI